MRRPSRTGILRGPLGLQPVKSHPPRMNCRRGEREAKIIAPTVRGLVVAAANCIPAQLAVEQGSNSSMGHEGNGPATLIAGSQFPYRVGNPDLSVNCALPASNRDIRPSKEFVGNRLELIRGQEPCR